MPTSRPTRSARRTPLDVRGWTALVTGASSGIGERFARDLAARGADLVLVARSADRLEALAEQLRDRHPAITVGVLPADLSDPDAPGRLVAQLEASATDVDLLVNNAGFGSVAPVAEQDPARLAGQIQVNCGALVALTARLLPGMVARGTGGVINVGSTAGFQPVATMAVYAATKAFVLSFTEALWAETRTTGVRVLALCPGGTQTAFFATAGREFLIRGRQTPEEVVEVALRAFLTGRGPTVVPGLQNRLAAAGYRFVPRAVMARLSGSVVGTH